MVRQEAKPIRPEPHVSSAAKRAASVGRVVHLSAAERAERGKAARAEVPRTSHADWAPAPGRPDPIELLEQQAATRVPELLPIRYGRMLVSPFTFFRGGALIMASDLAATPRSGFQVQLCGDAHLSNFGVFGTPERQPRVLHQRFRRDAIPARGSGISSASRRAWPSQAAIATTRLRSAERSCSRRPRSTATAMREFAGKSNLDVWYARMDIAAKIAELRAPAQQASDRERPRRPSRRRVRRTNCGPSPSSPRWSTASPGSSATRR